MKEIIQAIFIFVTCFGIVQAAQGQSSKLVYILSESRRLNVYVGSSGTAADPTVDLAVELIDSKTSQRIDLQKRESNSEPEFFGDLTKITVNSLLELPKADLIEGGLPPGVTQESQSNLSRNLFEEGMFVFRVPYRRGTKIAVVHPVNQILKAGKELAFRVLEPKSLEDRFTRHFSFALVQGSPNSIHEPLALVASIADIKEGNKPFGYGTVVVDRGNNIYHVSKGWMNLTNLKSGLKIISSEVPLPEVTIFGQTHTQVFDLAYKNDKIARLGPRFGTNSWPNGTGPVEIQDLSIEPSQRYRELQTQRIESRLDSNEAAVKANIDFTNKILERAEIAAELKRVGVAVLHSEVKTFSTIGSSHYYAVVKVTGTKGHLKSAPTTEISWVAKLNHYTQEIIGIQKLRSAVAARLQTVFPGDLMMTDQGKMEKLNFQSQTSAVQCRKVHNKN